MDVADKIGLLPGFGWMAGHSFWLTLGLCLIGEDFASDETKRARTDNAHVSDWKPIWQ